jgi:hypothetical protein
MLVSRDPTAGILGPARLGKFFVRPKTLTAKHRERMADKRVFMEISSVPRND